MNLIRIVKNTFSKGELSNEDYHQHEGVSGTGLSKIFETSVLSYLEITRKPSDALKFGIASHANFLEPRLFNKEFYQGFDESLYPNAFSKNAHFQDYLSEHGLKVSGSKAALKERVRNHAKEIEQNVQIMDDLREEWNNKFKGLTEVPHSDFKQLCNMRDRLVSDLSVVKLIEGAHVEKSIICEIDYFDELSHPDDENKGQFITTVKIRPDIVSKNFALVDYKTTLDCYGKFQRDIFKLNYDLKMALQYDILQLVYNAAPKVVLLAQNKLMPSELTNPHEYKPWILGREVLENGRRKYLIALSRWLSYKQTGIKAGQGNNACYLELPSWCIV